MKRDNKKKSLIDNYGKYSSIAMQMAIIIFAGVFGGYKIDKYFQLRIPVFTLVLSMTSVGLAIYIVIKDLLKK